MSDLCLRDLAIGRHSAACTHGVRSSSDPKILESAFVVCLWPHLAFRALGVLTVPYLRNNVVRRQSLQSFGSHRSTQLDIFYSAIKTREHRSSGVLSFAVAGVYYGFRLLALCFYRYVLFHGHPLSSRFACHIRREPAHNTRRFCRKK